MTIAKLIAKLQKLDQNLIAVVPSENCYYGFTPITDTWFIGKYIPEGSINNECNVIEDDKDIPILYGSNPPEMVPCVVLKVRKYEE